MSSTPFIWRVANYARYAARVPNTLHVLKTTLSTTLQVYVWSVVRLYRYEEAIWKEEDLATWATRLPITLWGGVSHPAQAAIGHVRSTQ
jgi:TM2 domain-containing membrane protein YozV